MDSERWRQVEQLYHDVLAVDPARRSEFLRRACGDDEGLRQELESLLRWERAASGDILDQPAWAGTTLPETVELELRVGAQLGPYRIQALLGAGGMGQVYQAEDLLLRRQVAIKTLRNVSGASSQARRRFLQEARAASSLNHPNIVQIYELRSEASQDFIVMEFVRGRTLAEALAERSLTVNEALTYAAQIASALAAVHSAGVSHRDIKPGNILITAGGGIKIIDFGLAKLLETSSEGASLPETAAGIVMGTALYMSPEQAEGKPVDARSDIFSTGAVLYEMLTGNRAFDGGSTSRTLSKILLERPAPMRSFRRDIPEALGKIVDRCLEKDPARRYSSGRELAEALETLRRSRTSSGARPSSLLLGACLVLALAAFGWLAYRSRRARWVRNEAIPQIEASLRKNEYSTAFDLTKAALRILPDDPQLQKYQSQAELVLRMTTSPPGARLLYRPYGYPKVPWRMVGITPIKDVPVPLGQLHWRIERDGSDPLELGVIGFYLQGQTIPLLSAGQTPPGMTPVPANADWLGPNNPLLPDYFLDRFEVTNRQFQAFVDAGGYQNRKYWRQPVRKHGVVLPFEQAIDAFRDETGRPGPAGWRLGAFPAGQEDLAVSGVNWYEADAYCAFVGKALPTVQHWRKAAGFGIYSSILFFSNFSSSGPAAVGASAGVSAAGAYDMAGNVKEWAQNSFGELRAILGGGWNEVSYTYSELDAQDPLLRKPSYGIRCALYPAGLPPASLAPLAPPERDYVKEKPVNDAVFDVYRGLYSYDPVPLEDRVESVDDSNAHWRAANVSYRAAYGDERIPARLYLPKTAQPPYQTVIWVPGRYAWLMHSRESEVDSVYYEFLAQTGRAVLYPAVKGTYDRWIRDGGGASGFRDMTVQVIKDILRSVEFLESRPDVRKDKLAYYGLSTGGFYGPLVMALEPRLKTGILVGSGVFTAKAPPEIDVLNFAPRVRVPVLMLSGRYDFSMPSETAQKPLLRWLGTPDYDKRLLQVESGHMVPVQDIVREALNWLDRYLGPVEEK